MVTSEEIVEYYDETLRFYRKFYYGKNSTALALHYGLWKKGTRSLEEALLNTNRVMAETAQLKSTDLVLDAGCGVGGSSIWIAKNYGAKVIGITVSEKQIVEANQLAHSHQVEHLTQFKLRSFLDTGFLDESFDVVWGIESICHALAEDKADFLQEAFRILKPKGRIIICDGFKKRLPLNEAEKCLLKDFETGWAVPSLALVTEFQDAVQRVGFTKIKFWDKTLEIRPSSWRLYLICKFLYPLLRIYGKHRITPETLRIIDKNCRAGVVQYQGFSKLGPLSYGMLCAEKT